MEMVPAWNELTPDEQKVYAKADRVWNGWRAHEEAAYGDYKDTLGDYEVVGDATWSKWAYMSKKDEIVGTCHSTKSYNSKPPRAFPMLTGVSKPHGRFLSRELHIPVRTVWNPVNVEDMEVRREKEDRFISLNRIMATKGIHLFLDAIERAIGAGHQGLLDPKPADLEKVPVSRVPTDADLASWNPNTGGL